MTHKTLGGKALKEAMTAIQPPAVLSCEQKVDTHSLASEG